MPDRALEDKLAELPDRPGVYRFEDAAGRVLYVGKAKSLRKRVRSYFRAGARHEARIARMVAEVADVDVIVVDTESEALILESNLVKRQRPRYNVVLRDDKNFPYLRVTTRDEYPRAGLVRRARRGGDRYVGPFLPAARARRTLKMLQRHFRVATCNEVFDGKRRPCLYYHLDQCLAPCAGKTTPEEYRAAVDEGLLFLQGRHRDLEAMLARRMQEASAAQDYEGAIRYRDTLRTVEGLAVRQRMASVGLEEQDYFGHHEERGQLALQLFEIRRGQVEARRTFTFPDSDLAPGALYRQVLLQLYHDADPPPEIYLPQRPAESALLTEWLSARRGARVRLHVPRQGAKRRMLDLVVENARLAWEERFRGRNAHGAEALEGLARALALEEAPYRIECFDISNIQGTDAVASLVVWQAGRPRKSEYRSFHIRGVEGPDDFASLAEAVERRYRRQLAEDRRLPDLVVIDGGKGQLSASVAAAARAGLPTIPMVGLAKREEEIFVPGRGDPIRLERHDPALRLLQAIRDEAHRFAVDRHRRRRKRRTLGTELTAVRGIGPAKARTLLRTFGSARAVREADEEALARAVGAASARAIRVHFRGGTKA